MWNRLGLGCLSWLLFLGVTSTATAVGNPAAELVPPVAEPVRLSIEVGMPTSLRGLPQDARLLVVLAPPGRGEPRDRIGKLGAQAPTLLGVDVPAGSKVAKVRVGDGADEGLPGDHAHASGGVEP